MTSLSKQDLISLPKAHLHLHLEGSMRPSTLSEFCSAYGIKRPADTRGKSFDNFGGFVEMYWAACNSVRSRDDLARLILEVAEDAQAQGVWWLEVAFDTARYGILREGSPDRLFETQEEGWRFAVDAARRASEATNVAMAFISAVDRAMSVEHAMERAAATKSVVSNDHHLIEAHAPGFEGEIPAIIGFGLHGDESGNPPEPFAAAFKLAREGTGLMSLPHAGEIARAKGDGSAYIKGAIDSLAADRIAHGVLAIEDPALVRRLADEQICLDVCPTSNILLRVFPSPQQHPLPSLLEAGVPCTIGSDDPLLFGPDLIDEYLLCHEQMGLNKSGLAQLARTSFQRCGAPKRLKQAGINAIDQWLG